MAAQQSDELLGSPLQKNMRRIKRSNRWNGYTLTVSVDSSEVAKGGLKLLSELPVNIF